MKKIISLITVTMLSGCQITPKSNSDFDYIETIKSEYKVEGFTATLVHTGCFESYVGESGCERFSLEVNNQTEQVILIDWNQSKYTENNNVKQSGFMFSGIRYTDRNNAKQPAVILPHSKFEIKLTPTKNVYFKNKWETYNAPEQSGAVIAFNSSGRYNYVTFNSSYRTILKIDN